MTGQHVDLVSRPATAPGLASLSFIPFDGTGTLLGFADFHIVGWYFRILGCNCHSQGDSRWVQLPSKPLIDKAGHALRDGESDKIRYVPVLAFDGSEVLCRFRAAGCAALDAYALGWRR